MNLADAKALFAQSYDIDQELYREHYRLLTQAIRAAVKARKRTLEYRVPPRLFGTYPMYDRREIALWLLRQLRAEGFHCSILGNECILSVWGWYQDIDEIIKADQTKNPPRPRIGLDDIKVIAENDSDDSGDNAPVTVTLKEHLADMERRYL